MTVDIAADAERVIAGLRRNNNEIALKTNQIRKFLTAVVRVNNKIMCYRSANKMTAKMSDELAGEVKFLKIKAVYQSKDKTVKEFVEKAKLIDRINEIENSCEKFEGFFKYIEALVAYHKFYGGKDK